MKKMDEEDVEEEEKMKWQWVLCVEVNNASLSATIHRVQCDVGLLSCWILLSVTMYVMSMFNSFLPHEQRNVQMEGVVMSR